MNLRPIVIRSATESDLAAINDIYNHYVLHSTCTYQEEPEPLEGRTGWFRHHGDKHPVIVAEMDGEVVGWAAPVVSGTNNVVTNAISNSARFYRLRQ